MTHQHDPLVEQIIPGWQIFYPRKLPLVPPPIFFCHIPKCGGTLIDVLLLTAAYVHNSYNRVWVKKANCDTTRPKIFSQHRALGRQPNPDQDWQIITLARDPVRRLVSHWAFEIGRGTFPRPENTVVKSLKSLETYLEEPRADNLQVRMLADVDDDAPVGPADLDRALTALNRCLLVGVQEQMEVFMATLISILLPWPVLTLFSQPNPMDGYYRWRTMWQDYLRHKAGSRCYQYDQTLYAAARARSTATREILMQTPAQPRDQVLIIPFQGDCPLLGPAGNHLPTVLPMDQVRELMTSGGYIALRPHLRTT